MSIITSLLLEKDKSTSKRYFYSLIFASLLSVPTLTVANVDLAESPLFLTSSVEPNILFILDDSGSMHWEIMPDEHISNRSYYIFGRVNNLYSSGNYTDRAPSTLHTATNPNVYGLFMRSPQGNAVFYDPGVTYLPWPRADETGLMPNADPEAAFHNPMRTNLGTRNLTETNSRNGSWRRCNNVTQSSDGSFSFSDCNTFRSTQNFWPATYYWHDGSNNYNSTNFTTVVIEPDTPTYTGHGRENRTDCANNANATCSYAEEIQNFANWYTYYRSRILASRGGIGAAFAAQEENMRVGYGTINASTSNVDGVSTDKIVRGLRRFEGSNREAFFDLLYDRDIPASGTPLRRSLQSAGEYFSRTDNRGPWGNTPGTNDPTPQLTCRSSYTILMTDGYWNGPSPNVGNVDNTQGSIINSPSGQTFRYTPADPYRDDYSNTLADVAMFYWKNDLRPDLDNEVPTSSSNEAFWQHMVTFGVGLGVTGSIDPEDAWNAVQNGTEIEWPNPTSSNPAKIDDLLHAGVNSRGGFFSAADPVTFANELSSVLQTIVDRTETSATSVAASSGIFQTGTLLFSSGFRSTDWSGYLNANRIEDGEEVLAWSAESRLALQGASNRNIFTKNNQTSNFVSLSFNNLSAQQQNALNHNHNSSLDGLGEQRVSWLRGTLNAHANLRSRQTPDGTRLLGDIINSNPTFMGRTDYGYSLLDGTEGSSYLGFRNSTSYRNRPDVIFVAANSGHFHAFNASDDSSDGGTELFAYIPSELLLPETGKDNAKIVHVMNPDYDHAYMLDGTATVGDAYLDDGWASVVIGTMGLGGRTVFALDVTDPESFNESNILWEFTDPDLGYGVTTPVITRLATGQWAAIFGNGYNSDNNRAFLFVVDITDGSLIKKIDTEEGSSTQPNGMSPVAVTDWPDLDLNAQFVYAGDLLGNMWRFDISSTSPSSWDNNNAYKSLFTARSSNNVRQPITVKPTLALHPDNPNRVVVLFGTGSYIRNQDAILDNPQTQTLYGIFDQEGNNWSISGRSQLLQQTIEWQSEVTFENENQDQFQYTVRQVSNNTMPSNGRGWYLDLIYDGVTFGERVISDATLSSGRPPSRVRFNTLIPNNDPCGAGREGFLMDINIADGGRYSSSVFDLNQDGVIDLQDIVIDGEIERIISGVKFGQGEQTTALRDPETGDDILIPGGDDDPLRGLGSDALPGRQYWQQLR